MTIRFFLLIGGPFCCGRIKETPPGALFGISRGIRCPPGGAKTWKSSDNPRLQWRALENAAENQAEVDEGRGASLRLLVVSTQWCEFGYVFGPACFLLLSISVPGGALIPAKAGTRIFWILCMPGPDPGFIGVTGHEYATVFKTCSSLEQLRPKAEGHY